ncbi:MAG: hypothetical protein HY079_11595 [Elusimicrobia bacterium]|nr:hypothetical protein [Elusimicrobiota bacterium]
MKTLLSALAVALLAGAVLAATPAVPRDACADPRPTKEQLKTLLLEQKARRDFSLSNDLARGQYERGKTVSLELSEDGRLQQKIQMAAGSMVADATDERVDAVLQSVCERRKAAAGAAAAERAAKEREEAYRAKVREENSQRQIQQAKERSARIVSLPGASSVPDPTPAAAPAPAVEDRCGALCARWEASACDEGPNTDSCRPMLNIGRHNGCACVH